MEFKKSIENRFCPIVVVSASPEVEKTCKILGLTFLQLLRPFRWLQKDSHIRTVKDAETLLLKGFCVRFLPVNVRGIDDERFSKYVHGTLKESLERAGTLPEDLETCITDSLSQTDTVNPSIPVRHVYTTPWFERFRNDYIHNFRFHHADTFDHPVGAIIAVSSQSADPIAEFKSLYPPRPAEYNYFGVDPNIAAYYVLVHDTSSTKDYERVLKQMGETFGPGNCRVLLLNTKDLTDANQHIWKEAYSRLDDSSADTVSAKVSNMDLVQVGSLVEQYITFSLLPFLERRIRTLVQVINEKRQGVMSKMVSWFRSDKPQTAAANQDVIVTTPNGEPRFGREAVEMQCRRLADLCFMLHDYDNAANYYKILRTDLSSNERPWVKTYLAACLEGYGITLFLLGKGSVSCRSDRERKDDNRLDVAYEMYRESGERELAFRSSLIMYHYYMCRGFHDRAAALLHRAWGHDGKTNLVYISLSAEQAALCYLSLPPLCTRNAVTYIRKSALYLTLAGHRYRNDQPDHSIRCYRLALLIYNRFKGQTWAHVWEHCNDSLARLNQKRGNSEDCVMNHTRLFQVVSPGMKSVLIADRMFKELVSNLDIFIKQKGSVSQLPFPVIRAKDVHVAHAAKGLIPSGIEVSTRRHFQEMEDELRKYLISARKENYLLHPQSKSVMAGSRDVKLIVGETASVKVVLRNPLAVEVVLNDVHALFRSSAEPQPRDAPYEKGEIVPSITLKPMSETVFPLRFTPSVADTLRIIGVGITLANTVKGSVYFEEAPHLVGQVSDMMPCLDVSLHPPISAMLDGQLSKLELTLTNVSTIPMSKVVVKLSHKNMHILQISLHSKGEEVPLPVIEDTAVCALPEDMVIEPFASLKLYVYVCANRGLVEPYVNVNNYLAFLFSYSNTTAPIQTRLYKFLHIIKVESSLTLCHMTHPASVGNTTSTRPDIITALQLRNTNKQISNMSIVQLSAISKSWNVRGVVNGDAPHEWYQSELHKDNMYYLGMSPSKSSSDGVHMDTIMKNMDSPEVRSALERFVPGKKIENEHGVDCTAWPLFSLIHSGYHGSGTLHVAPTASQTTQDFAFYADKGGAKPLDEVDVDMCALLRPVAFVCLWACEMEGAVMVGMCTSSTTPKMLSMNPLRPLWTMKHSIFEGTPVVKYFDPKQQFVTMKIHEERRLQSIGCITVAVDHPGILQHNFLKSPSLLCPVTIILRNNTEVPQSVTVRLLQGNLERKTGPSNFWWVGKTQHHVILEPKVDVSVALSACVMNAGMVSLKNIAVTTESAKIVEVQTMSPEKWCLRVVQQSC